MTPYISVALGSVLAAGLTLYSGFGLGTILMPVFALFFPLEMAVAATAVVHCSSNFFKIIMVGRYADRSIVVRFGIPAVFSAFIGGFLLSYLSGFSPLASYVIGSKTAMITPVKLVMSILIFTFALFEILPGLKELHFDRNWLLLGGVLSGFFGGLSGHQGALRSAFLVKSGLTTESFVGTNAVIAFVVDLGRMATYAVMFFAVKNTNPIHPNHWPMVLTGIGAAFVGISIGKRFLHKITMKSIQTLTSILLLLIAAALGSGLI